MAADAAAPIFAPSPANPDKSSASADTVFCPELEEDVPALLCERIRQVNSGVAAVKANSNMIVGETQVVRLVVSRSGDEEAVVDEIGGPDSIYKKFKLSTGRYMEARLTVDNGLEITPTDWVRKDLGAGDVEDWEWNVKALAEGRFKVLLLTRVLKRQDDGTFITRPGRESEPQYVDVKITRSQEVEQQLGVFKRWLDALAAPAESLGNLLTLLGTVIAAAGGLWLAIRQFGKRE